VLTDATSQLLTMKQKGPDFAYINTNTQWVPVVLKDSYKLGLKTKYMVNNYGIDERTPGLAGAAAEGVMGIQDVAYWGDNVPGMKILMDFHQKHHPNDHATPRPTCGGGCGRFSLSRRLSAPGLCRPARGQEGPGKPEGLRYPGSYHAVHLYERGSSADHAGQARRDQGRKAGVGARCLCRP
jgi:hypothetical protein